MAYRSPLLDLPGAVEADGPDAGVAAHYGEPMREQRLLVAGEAFADLSHRGVVRIAGPDRLSGRTRNLHPANACRFCPQVLLETDLHQLA